MRRIKTTLFAADRLAQMVATGALAMPDFQRDFVWEPSQVVDFLESVANNWPTGSLLFLEAPPTGVRPKFSSKGFKDGPSLHRGRPEYYVLDGQQRLTALFHAYYNASAEYVYFLATEGEDLIRSTSRKRYERVGLDPENVLVSDFVGIASHARRESSAHKMARQLKVLHRELSGFTPGEYSVPVVILPWDVELAALAKIFETINRTGVRLNAFDLMVAVLFPQGFELRKQWDLAFQTHDELANFEIDGVQVLRLIALWSRADADDTSSRSGPRGVRQSDILRVPGEFVQQRWSQAIECFVQAVQFGRKHLGMSHPSLVPSDSMLLTMAGLLSQSSKPRVARLNRWFWTSCLTQAHAQGANTQVVADFDTEGLSSDDEFGRTDIENLLRQPLARNAIAARGLSCALVRAGARDPITGELISELDPDTEVQVKSLAEIVGRKENPPMVGDVVVLRKGSLPRLREALTSGDFFASDNLETQQLNVDSLFRTGMQEAALKTRIRFYCEFIEEAM